MCQPYFPQSSKSSSGLLDSGFHILMCSSIFWYITSKICKIMYSCNGVIYLHNRTLWFSIHSEPFSLGKVNLQPSFLRFIAQIIETDTYLVHIASVISTVSHWWWRQYIRLKLVCFNETTWCHILEGFHLDTHENLKSYNFLSLSLYKSSRDEKDCLFIVCFQPLIIILWNFFLYSHIHCFIVLVFILKSPDFS
jgi:hypothetical protein